MDDPAIESLDSSLEGDNTYQLQQAGQFTPPTSKGARGGFSLFGHFNKSAFAVAGGTVAVIAVIAAAGLLLGIKSNNKNNSGSGSNGSANYAVTTIPLKGVNNDDLLQINQSNALLINGDLTVKNSLTIVPSTQPAAPKTGQLYYDAKLNELYFYNGAKFIPIGDQAPNAVTSLGGASGTVPLGVGLEVRDGQLRLTDSIIQAATAVGGNGSTVSSVQGQTGNVVFSAGAGVSINGTNFVNTGVLSIGGAAGNVGVGRGLVMQGGSLKSTISLASGSANLLITDDGNGNFTITDNGSGSNQVTLGPPVAQVDASNNTSIHINKTGSGNYLQFADNGTTTFAVDRTGLITSGTIAYSNVVGAPVTTVTSLGGVSGAISVGTGLKITSNTLSNDGILTITGTANQISTLAVGNDVTLSLPQNINTTSSPTFSNITATGNVTVQGGSVVVGVPGATNGFVSLANSASARVVKLQGLNPSGAGDATIQFPSIAGGGSDLVCLMALGNCAGAGGGVTTSGSSAGYIPVYNGAQTITNSVLFQSGTALGVNTTTPGAYVLNVQGGNVNFSGNATIGNGVNVTGTSSFAGNTSITGTNTFTVGTGATTLGGTLGVTGATTLAGLSVGAASTFNGNVGISGSNTLTVGTGATSLGGTLAVTGGATFNGAITQIGATSFSTGTGAVSLNGDTTIASGKNLAQTGAGTFSSGTGNVSLNGNTAVTGSKTFTVGSGATVLGGILNVAGLTTLSNGVDISGTVTINTTGTASTSIGNSGAALSLTSSGFNVTTAGAVTGVTTLSASGAISGSTSGNTINGLVVNGGNLSSVGSVSASGGYTQTGASANTFSGATSFTAAGTALSVSNNATVTGTLTSGTLSVGTGGISTSGTLSVTGSGASSIAGALSLTAAGVALNVTNNATIGGSLGIQGANGLTLGTAGSVDGKLKFANNGNTDIATITVGAPVGGGNTTYNVPSIASNTSDTFCLYSLGNCGASPNTVSTSASGTTNAIPKFTGPNTIADSNISDDGSTVTVSALLSAANITTQTIQSTGTLSITPGGNLSIGATNHVTSIQGSSGSTFTVNASGFTSTLGFVNPTANRTINLPNESGTVCLQNSVNCGFASSGSGVTTLDELAGTLTIANSSGSGATVTIDNASTAAKGIASFNSTNFSVSSGVVNTIQDIATTSNVQFGGLTLGSGGNLTLSSTGTVYTNNITGTAGATDLTIDATANAIVFKTAGGTNSFVFPTMGGTGQVICTSGITCAAGGGQALILEPSSVQSVNSNRTAIFVNKTGGTGNILQLQSAGTDAIVIDASGNATISTLAVSGTLTTNTITSTGALTVGNTAQAFTIQGTGSSVIKTTDGGFNTTIGFNIGSGGTAPTGAVNYQFQNDNSVAPGTYNVCTTSGNCAGVGGSVTTTGGTAGKLSKFTAAGNIADSIVGESGSVITIGGSLNVGVSGSAALTLGVASTTSGTLVFNNSSNNFAVTFTPPTTAAGNTTLQLPDQSGTVAVAASGPILLDAVTGQISCPSCLTSGGGAGGGVSSITGTTSGSAAVNGALTFNNALTSGSSITIDNASTTGKGIAQFNSTNFSVSSGTVNTIQNINTTAAVTFNDLSLQGTVGLTLGSSSNVGQVTFKDGTADGFTDNFSVATLTANRSVVVPNASGTIAVSGSGNINLSALGDITVINNPSFTTSVTSPIFQGSGALSVKANGGTLSVGTSLRPTVIAGDATSTFAVTSGANTTTVGFTAPSAARSILFPNESGTLCLQTSTNCGFAAASNVVNSLDGLAGVLTIGNSSGAGAVITINDASTTQKGIAQFNATNFSDNGSGTINTIQDISSTSTPSFSGATLGASGLTVNGAATLNGNASISGTNTLTVGTGLASFGGGLSVTAGLTTLSGGATITGAVNINRTGTANTAIGNATGTFALTSSALNISTAGALSGITTLALSGAITGATSGNTINGLVINSGALSAVSGYAQASGNFAISGSGTFDTGTGAVNLNGNTTVSGSNTFTVNSGLSSLNGGLAVSGNGSVSGILSVGSSSQFQVDASGNATTSGTFNGQTISSSSIFTGSVAVQGASGLTVGVAGTTNGSITLANSTSTRKLILQGLNPTGAGDATLQIPSFPGGTTDNVCLLTLANCVGAGGSVSTSGGTQNYITKYNNAGATQISNSQLFDNGSFVGLNTTTNNGQLSVVASASQAGLYLQGAATGSAAVAAIQSGGSTGDLLQFQSSTSSVKARFDNNGAFYGNYITSSNGLYASITNAGSSPFTAQQLQANATAPTAVLMAGASQTGDLLQVQAFGSSTALSGIDSVGNFYLGAGQSIKLNGSGTRPSSPTAGQLYYDTSTNQMLQYNGSKWVSDRSTSTKIVAASNASQALKDAADYIATGTGDQATINTALTAAAGGSVYLTEGTYTVSAAISIPNNTTLFGAGAGTLITIPNAQNGSYSIITNTDTTTGTHVTIHDLQIDGNKANQTAGSMNGITLNGMGGGSSTTARDGAKVTNVTVRSLLGSGINLSSSSNNTITGNTSQGNSTYGINLSSSSNNTVTGNMTQGNNYGIGMTFSPSNTITGNTSQGNSQYGILLSSSSNNTVTGNTLQTNSSAGVLVLSSTNNLVASNKLHDNGGNTANSGIYFLSSTNNTVTDNDITDTSCTTNCYAINVSDVSSAGNYLSNNRHSGTVANPSTINDAAPNTIYANQIDGSSNLILRGSAGVGINTTSPTASLQNAGGFINSTLSTPAAPTVTTQGTAGSTSYTYAVTAYDGIGETLPSTGTTIATGNATLSGANFNRIVPARVSGAVSYKIYRTAGPGSTGLIGTVAGGATTFQLDDNGLAATTAVPVANTTGSASIAGSLNVSGSSTLTGVVSLGTASNVNGQLKFYSAANTGSVTLQGANTAGNYTVSFPGTIAGNDTVCLVNVNNCVGAGATSVGALDGGTANSSGATISSNVLYLQSASTSYAGLVNTVAQTLAGAKTFSGAATFSAGVTVAASQSISLVGGITSTRPASPTAGMLYYDTTTNTLLTYNGTKWMSDKSASTKIVATSATGGASSAVASQNPDGADFVNASTTSAQTVINNAIAALPATGGSIYLMEGTYIIDGTINVPNNVTISGAGSSTIIKLKNATNSNVNVMTNSDTTTGTGVVIQNLSIDGNQANQTSGTMHGIYLNGMGASGRDGARIANVYVYNMYNSTGIYLNSSYYNTITGSTLSGSQMGVAIQNSSSYNTVTGNTFRANSYDVFVAANYNTITGNTAVVSSFGIYVGANYNTITGNTLSGGAYGVFLTSGRYNTVTGNAVSAAAGSGIELQSSVNNTVSGNKISDSGNADNNGIYFTSSSFNTVTSNDITDTSCSTTCYAINVFNAASQGNYLADNHHSGTATNLSTINDAGTSTIYANQQDGNGNLINRNQGALTVGTTTASKTLTLQGSLSAAQLPTPAAPTLATAGTVGSTSYTYAVSALDGSGETLPSTGTTIATGNATLNGTNYVTITWNQVGGAVQYKVFRTASGGTPATTGLIGTVAGNVFSLNDTGLAASGAVAGANTTGNATIAGQIQGGSLNITGTTNLIGVATLGTASSVTGQLKLANAASAFLGTIQVASLTQNTVYTLPASTASTDTICLVTLNNCVGSGATSVGSIDSQTPSANGGVISAGTLYLQSASASNPGLVNTAAQTFAGAKTFSGVATFSAGVTVAASQSINLVGGITSTRPSSPTAGMLYFDTTTNQFLQYNGTKWVAAHDANTKIVAASNSSQAVQDAADYVATGTGDQATINTALTAAASGTVYLAEGTYTVSAAISIPNDTTLLGAGAGTLITIPNAQNGNYKIITNTDTTTGNHVTIHDLQIDGNKANQSSGTMYGIYLDHMGGGSAGTARDGAKITNVIVRSVTTGANGGGIYLNTSSNNTITANTTQGNANAGIYLNSSSNNNTVTGNNVQGNTYGVYLNSSTYNTITGNTTQGNAYGTYLNSSSNNTVTGNTAQGNTSAGVYLNSSSNNTVTGNTTQGSGNYGITLVSSSNNTITANTAQANNNYGIFLSTSSNNNTITANNVQGNTIYGINLSGSSNNTIGSNKVHDNGALTNNNGIYLQASSLTNTITGNDITDTSCTTTCYAINISDSGSTANLLSANHLSSTETINDAASNTIYDAQMNGNGDIILKTISGKVGVNTLTPAEALNVYNGNLQVDYGNIKLNPVTAPTAPTVAVNATAGNLTGTLYYMVSFITGSGETNYGTLSAGVSPSSQKVDITNIPIGTSGVVTGRKIYRSANGGALPYKLVTTINDNTTTTYTDNIANGSLGVSPQSINTTAGQLQVNGSRVFYGGSATDSDVYLGLQAGSLYGARNVAIGSNTLAANILGSTDNVAVGSSALQSNTSGTSNTAVGSSALQANTTGAGNIAIGASTLSSATTASFNTVVGYQSAGGLTVGINNTVSGANALAANSTGSYNTIYGSQAASQSSCASGAGCNITAVTAVGYQAGFSLQTGSDYGTLLGYQAGYSNTTGGYNTNVGYQAGYLNQTGSGNVFIGKQAGYNETGSNKLYIANSNTTTPLIGGDFSAGTATINGAATVKSLSGNSTTAFQIQNNAGNNLLTADTTNMRLAVNATYAAMTTPTGLTAAVATAGGSLTATTTYFYTVTAIDSAGGETVASTEVSRATTGTNKTIPLTWTAVTGASGYKVYRATSTNAEVYLTTVLANSYTDDGTITIGSATPPGATNAYVSTNASNNSLQLTVGGNGTPTGQVYVGGTVPSSTLASIVTTQPNNVIVRGNYVYVLSSGGTLSIYDISNNAAPKFIGSVSVAASNTTSIGELSISGTYAYVAGTDVLSIVNISNPSSPSLSSSLTVPGLGRLTSQGSIVYVTTSTDLIVIDASNPSSPKVVSDIVTGQTGINGVGSAGRYVYTASSSGTNLKIFDVSNISSPVNAGGYNPSQTSTFVTAQGRYAYVAAGNGILIVDISNPASTVLTGNYNSGETYSQLVLQGRYLYAKSSSNSNVRVIDISNPTTPALVGSISTTGSGGSLSVQGRYAYAIAWAGARLEIFDLGGTYSQQLEAGGAEFGSLQVDSNAQVSGDANVQGGLIVGRNIQAAGNLGVAGNGFIQGALAIAGGIQGGVTVNGLSTPSAPTITTFGTAGSTSYSYAIVAVSASGGTTPASSAGTIATANATLTPGNYNVVTWTPVAGAVSYKIYRTASGGTPATTGLIATTSANTLQDTGLAGDSSTASATNTSGQFTLNGPATFNENNLNTFGIVSDLTAGARSSYAMTLSQANNASNDNSVGLLQLTNSDTGSTGSLLNVNQVSAGTAISVTGVTSGLGLSLNTISTGTGIGIANISSGTGLSINSNAIMNTGKGISIIGPTLTSGKGITITGAGGTITNAFTGQLLDLSVTRSITTTLNDTGNFINAVRTLDVNNGGSTLTVSGALATLSSICTQTAGTCTDTSNILNLNQQYASASGAVLNIANSGTGNAIAINQPNNTAAITITGSTTATALITSTTSGTALNLGSVTSGTAISAAGVNTGTGLSLSGLSSGTGINLGGANFTTGNGILFNTTAASVSTGSALKITGSASANLGSYTGNLIDVTPTRTQTGVGTVTDTGNFINLTRANTITNASGTFNITGALANLQSNCTQTAGTCTDSSNIINLNQQYTGSTGAVANIQNSGTGNFIQLQNATNATVAKFDANGGLTVSANTNVLASVAGAGTAATSGLSVTGQKGGNTTGTTGQTAGAGAGISLTAGAGGDAPSGSTNANGGSITLQGGTPGSGAGTAGTYGNISLQVSGGNVGVGVASPSALFSVGTASALQVNSSGNLTTTGTIGYADGTANNATYVCKNASGLLAGCSTTGTGAAFVQGGNSFGATAVLGTKDANALQIITGASSTVRATFDTSNNLYLGNGITAAAPPAFTLRATGGSAAGTAGAALTVSGGAGTTTTTGSAGGDLNLNGGNANGDGSVNRAGGSINLQAGTSVGASANPYGNIILQASGGSIGIGNGSPSQNNKLDVLSTPFSSVGATAAINSVLSVIDFADTSVSFAGIRSSASVGNSNVNYTGSLTGASIGATFTGGSAKTLSNLYGLEINAFQNNSNAASAVTSAYGAKLTVQKISNGGIGTAYGLYTQIQNTNATGTIGTAYGLYVDSPVTTGAITTNYAAALLGGNVGIGTAAPGSTLTVNGATFLQNSAAATGATLNIQSTATQTTNYNNVFEFHDKDGNLKDYIDPYGNAFWVEGIFGTFTGAPNTGIITGRTYGDTTKGIVLKAFSGTQSANMIEIQDSSSNPIFTVGGAGTVGIYNDTTIAAGKSLTLTSGAGTIVQNFSTATTSSSATTFNVTNGASSGTVSINGMNVAVTGTANASGANTINGLNFANATAQTNNTYNGLNFGTGYTNLIQSAGFQISGAGVTTIKNDSVNAFLVQNAAQTTTILTVNTTTSGNGSLIVGNATNGVMFALAGAGNAFEPALVGTAQHTKYFTVNAEYAGAVTDISGDATCSTNNVGTLTAGYDSTNKRNYYNWTATDTTNSQCYDLVVQVPVPADWSAWNGAPTIDVKSDNLTNATAVLDVLAADGTQEGTSFGTTLTPGSTGVWTAMSFPGLTSNTTKYPTNSASFMTIRIRMTGKSSSNLQLGTMKFSYKSKY